MLQLRVLRSPDYHTWQQRRIALVSDVLVVATKPGVFAHGHDDAAAEMLANAARSAKARSVLSLGCGNGLVGLAALKGGAGIAYMTDRHGLSIEATRRTLELAGPEYIERALVESGHGTPGLPADIECDVAFIRAVHERLAMQLLILDALKSVRPGGRIYIAGATEEGIKPATRWLELLCGAARIDAQRAGHRLVSARVPERINVASLTASDDDQRWLDRSRFFEIPVDVAGQSIRVATRPGVFSWEHLDEASEVLLQTLVPTLSRRTIEAVLDLGCGAGVIGAALARALPSARVTMMDVDFEAVRCAQQTIEWNSLRNAHVSQSDIAAAASNDFDLVVANPPFHVGKHTVLDVPIQFMRDAFAHLRPGGAYWLVANRTLPYEAELEKEFGNVRTEHDGVRFKVLSATRNE